MGVVIRQSIVTTLVSYAGAVIGYVNLLYLFPKFLNPEQVGLLRTIQDAAILFAPFAQFGLAQSIYRFYPAMAKDKKSEASFISLILLLAVLGFGIFFILFKILEPRILSYFRENAGEIIHYASTVLWLTLILLLTAVFEAYSRSLLRAVVPNILRELVIRAALAGLVTTYFLGGLTYDGFIIGTVAAYLACLLALVAYLVLQGRLSLSLSFSSLEKHRINDLVRYSFFSFAGTAGMIIVGKVDSMMVAGLSGLTAVAVYTTAFYMATVIEIPKRAIAQFSMPLIARAFEGGHPKDVALIYEKVSINQLIIGCLLLIGVYINLDNIFELMPRKEVYEAGKWVVVLVGIGKLADMAFGPSSEIIVLSPFYRFNIVLILLLATLVIVANNILIPMYGITGAAAGAAMTLIVFNLVKYIFIYVKFGIQPFGASTLKVVVVSGIALFINRLIPKIDLNLLDLFIRSSVVTVFFSAAILLLKVSPDANLLFKRAVEMIPGQRGSRS